MEKRGRKRGCSDVIALEQRRQLYEHYDILCSEERMLDPIRAMHLPRSYYIEKLFDLHIASWSKSRIRRLLIYRFKDDRK